ncbi:hypothetical protein PCARR_a1838 [Pseudoalteromonas carrageenovora IAM 12662]|uniref:Transposase n=1 Tax=Pseudoalteromonas carrageenovora IAM 12662 TaxID=1314868 RepID=A0ABR9ESP5_PSEVC|nr:hypothetical protein [Pseudoalteromonas carrageenovora IAM 12662]
MLSDLYKATNVPTFFDIKNICYQQHFIKTNLKPSLNHKLI